MKLVNAQNRIQELMARFVTQIEMGAAMSKTDLNKAAETILIPLLNEVYGWNLKNINYAEDNNNYPGIDLADETAGITIQVTATSDLSKVKHTLEQFIKHHQHRKYDRLIIYILTKRQNSYSKTAIQRLVQNKFNFDSRRDIWDYCNILKEVVSFQIDKALKVQGILEANFGEDQGVPSSVAVNQEQQVDWRETCRGLLNHWRGLTTNVLTKPNGIRFQLDEIFIPLGLVERQEKSKQSSNNGSSAERGSELYQEKITPISQSDFFGQVLQQRQSKQSQGSRIAIVGEPGAGKTTQLQKIGDWILKETEGIPIWIPLAEVGTRKLKDYLLNDWLQTAIQRLEVLQQHRDELGQLLKTGEVWLLLDGVDEMPVSDALYQINTQMREGWLQNVRVVLTCRLNVWDVSKNVLDGFDVYRNLDFTYPTEVHQFIEKWFVTELELQQKLKTALEQPGKERIQDMVKNPLRLTLLCYSWQLRQGELPETKAGLYEWFVDTFYEWNKGKVPIKLDTTRRKELNRALGELAKEAIDRESSRFRLREKFVTQFLGAADDEDSLFYLALQLGWLNRVGVAEENPLENVYAFFHPTFQEYFAALGIEHWKYFLSEDIESSENVVEEDEFYRIFEPEWLEVILLWVGRPDLDNGVKQDFVYNLVCFEDVCFGCYNDRAFLLATSIISEFNECDLLDEIIEQLIQCAFGDCKDFEWIKAPDFIVDEAKSSILKTNQKRLLLKIQESYKLKPDAVQLEIAELLLDIYNTNPLSTQILENLAAYSKNEHTCLQASVKLLDGDADNTIAIKALHHLADTGYDDSIQVEAATKLLSSNPQNSVATKVLINLAVEQHDTWAIEGLGYAYGNTDAIKALEQIIKELKPIIRKAEEEEAEEGPECSSAYWTAEDSLYQINSQQAIDSRNITATPSIYVPDEDYINAEILEDLHETLEDLHDIESQTDSISDNGEEVIITDENLFNKLLETYLETHPNNYDQNLTGNKSQVEIEISETEQLILQKVEKLLGGRDLIISRLLSSIYTTEDDEAFYERLDQLEKVGKNNAVALRGVIDLAIKGTRSHRLNAVIDAIENIGGLNNLTAIEILLLIILTPQEEENQWLAEYSAESLKEILQDVNLMIAVVAFLGERIANIDLEANPEVSLNCHSVLWHCSQHLSYPDFFNAWYSSSPTEENE